MPIPTPTMPPARDPATSSFAAVKDVHGLFKQLYLYFAFIYVGTYFLL